MEYWRYFSLQILGSKLNKSNSSFVDDSIMYVSKQI